MPGAKTNCLRIDPRTGLLLLVLANVIAFSGKSLSVELGTLGLLLFLTVLCGQFRSALKWGAAITFLFALQWYILPASPKIIATSFSIFVNYARKMLPCLMIGGLLISTLSLREIIAALRSFHVPQKLIISISVTLRYFPAIKEEVAHIRDAMRLRNINGLILHFQEGCTLQGSVTAAGLPVAKTEVYELAKYIGSVFQNPQSQFFNLDTDSEIAFGLENEGMPSEQIQERIEETVSALQIQNLLKRNIFALSGGEKQTLAFASVYAMSPAIYVLDEPTANLDEQAIERLRQQIMLLKSLRATVVVAEHRLYFLADIIDRAIYIHEGKLLHSFTGEEFCQLYDERRKELGLRTIKQTGLNLPEVTYAEDKEGLTVMGLGCAYKKGPNVFENLSFEDRMGLHPVQLPESVGSETIISCFGSSILLSWSDRRNILLHDADVCIFLIQHFCKPGAGQ